MDYGVIPEFTQHIGYGEARRVPSPRWYAATRIGYIRTSAAAGRQVYELAVGYRPNRYQIAKLGYEIQQGPNFSGAQGNTLALQLVSSFRVISIARD